MKTNFKNTLKLGGLMALLGLYSACNKPAPKMPVLVGAPKGYHMVDFQLPTKGDVDTIWFLPHGDYSIIPLRKGEKLPHGGKEYIGVFKYHIEPDLSFTPKDDLHSDMYGRTPQNNPYWYAERPGTVTLVKGTIDHKFHK